MAAAAWTGAAIGGDGSKDPDSIPPSGSPRVRAGLTEQAANPGPPPAIMCRPLLMTETTGLTFLHLGDPTGLKFVVDHGGTRVLFEMGIEHAPGAAPFS